MSDRTHKKQLERARSKRQADRLASRAKRSRIIVLVMVGLLVLSLVGVAILGTGGEAPRVDDVPDDADADTDVTAQEDPCPLPGDEVPTPTAVPYDEPPRADIDEDATYTATLDTTCGVIELELDAAGAPRTVENFVALAEDQYYNGAPFHRVIDGFMIQGGDPTGTGSGCVDPPACETELPGYTIDEETEVAETFEPLPEQPGLVVYPRGTLAMAKTQAPSSTGSQFFIVQGEDGAPLPPEYTAFGQVTQGMDVVDDIARGRVEGDQAVQPAAIRAVRIETS